MAKLTCPHCAAPGIAWWRKLFLGPARSVGCDACGARASVPAWSMVMAVPIMVAIFVGYMMIDAVAVRWIIIAAGFAVAVYLQLALVPLIRR